MATPEKTIYHLMTVEEQEGISIYYYSRLNELVIRSNNNGFKLGSKSKQVSVSLNEADSIRMIQFMEDNGVKPF